jgi:hypothetical protein
MKLREWDWDKQRFVEVPYPDEPIMEFINFIRTTKAWVQDPERMHREVLKLDRKLGEHRQAAREAMAATVENVTGQVAAPPSIDHLLEAAKNGSAPEWLRVCAAEIVRLRAKLASPKKAKRGTDAAHAEG